MKKRQQKNERFIKKLMAAYKRCDQYRRNRSIKNGEL